MPKLKEVKVTKNSMSWNDISFIDQKTKIITTIPKRELLNFLEKGKTVKKITVEFAD